jgi:4-diphosphocytidyl-2-C-methyl-D-erythritol kinase
LSRVQRLRLRAPAKLNLGLHITGRRPDGYHELDAIFVPLDRADALDVELRPARGELHVSLRCVAEPGLPGRAPDGEANLAARAARAFCERAGLALEVRITLHKRIPAPGGLGGGSSDAAAVLRGLAAQFPDALGRPDLVSLAGSLGADVPFFLGPPGGDGPTPARVRGIGDRVERLAGVPVLDCLLLHPGGVLETPRVYAAYDARAGAEGASDALTPPAGAPSISALLDPEAPSASDRWRRPDWLRALLTNDLEPAAVGLLPELAERRRQLEALEAMAVGLSGSGPTLFGIFPDAPAAAEALERARRLGLGASAWIRTARTSG